MENTNNTLENNKPRDLETKGSFKGRFKVGSHSFQTLLTIIIMLSLTTALYLYTSGYRITRNQGNDVTVDLKRTGLIRAKSIPEGANVYINDVLYTATNDTIAGLDPGTYRLRIVRNGFVVWEKSVEVFAELVTDITAVMVSQTPRLEPLTNTGARVPAISPTLSKLAYFSKDGQESGLWVIPLTNQGIGLFRSEPYVAIEDTARTIFSNGKSIEWSPDESEILISTDQDIYYLVDLDTQVAESTASPELTRESWLQETLEDKQELLDKVLLEAAIKEAALKPDAVWAPDGMKFLLTQEKDGNIEYKVYNLEKPLPVGEKLESLVFSVSTEEPQPKVSWYADSFHLILVEGNVEEEKRGTISLIRIDGTNKTEIYNNTIFGSDIYSTPSGDKLIFLTSFRSNEQTDLYTIGIR